MKDKQANVQRFYINNHWLSWIVLGCVLSLFFSFFAGYFLGKQSMVSLFVSSIEQNSLADHVCASLYSRCDLHNNQENQELCNTAEAEPEHIRIEKASESMLQETKIETTTNEYKEERIVESDPVEVDLCWYAQLIGFKTRRAANRFIEKLGKHGITVHLKTRYSENTRGKRIVWYQAVTPKYNDRTLLEDMVQKIKKTARIDGIRVITC